MHMRMRTHTRAHATLTGPNASILCNLSHSSCHPSIISLFGVIRTVVVTFPSTLATFLVVFLPVVLPFQHGTHVPSGNSCPTMPSLSLSPVFCQRCPFSQSPFVPIVTLWRGRHDQ